MDASRRTVEAEGVGAGTPAGSLSERGIALAGQGRLVEAEACFREAARLRPDDAAPLNHLGALRAARGDWDGAESAYRGAIRLRPDFTPARINLALALRSRGMAAEAADAYRDALRLQPDSAEAHHGLGRALRTLGRHREAADHFLRAVRLRPDATEARVQLAAALVDLGDRDAAIGHALRALALPASAATSSDLGRTFLALRRPDEAASCFRRVLRDRPDDADARNNLGTALWEQGRPDEAEAHYRRAIALRPDDPDLLNNLGNALWDRARPDEAADCYRRALALRPDSAETLTSLGLVLSGLSHSDEAVDCCRRALALRPDSADAHDNLGAALGRRGLADESLACFDRALEIRPDHAEAHRNRAMARLARGDFARGWDEYEWRWRCRGRIPPRFTRPPWDGGDLSGRTILLHAEQGLGDTLQFVRYTALVKRRGGNVLLLGPTPLARLLCRTPGIDRVLATDLDPATVPEEQLPPFDVHAPLLSLPRIFGTTGADIPADVPYLSADPDAVGRLRGVFEASPGFRVGIVWQGNPRYRLDRLRSFPLARLAPLAGVQGVRFIALQQGAGSEQLGATPGRFPVAEARTFLGHPPRDFLETAAILPHLDLVVTADSAVGHLAGGMGIRTWLALPYAAEWRWLADRDDSPWYPGHRLFRQETPGDWDGVFRRMADALALEAASRAVGGATWPVEGTGR
jgi:tetratricopeptide (TPR) repeat protein